ncbi:hypothetical protein, partial [Acetobacter indonesiensis]|uniref:hypothetical protein n=1 Tax=Acetobacter indonesiensis TaxID=104101 RepID=UPI001C4E5703
PLISFSFSLTVRSPPFFKRGVFLFVLLFFVLFEGVGGWLGPIQCWFSGFFGDFCGGVDSVVLMS